VRPAGELSAGHRVTKGINMNSGMKLQVAACLGISLLAAAQAGAQSFGSAKEKVTLLRKHPALVHLPGDSIEVKVTGRPDQADLARDLQSRLEAELTKDDRRLRVAEHWRTTGHPDRCWSE
jgi:hypothetical protein